jgi:glucose/arabinose dehydrogenase
MNLLLALCTLALANVLIVSVNSDPATTAPFVGQTYATVSGPRGLYVDSAGDILVLSRGQSRVIVLFETSNGDDTIRVDQVMIVNGQGLGLNHGLTYHNGYVYASSQTMVYRWPYVAGSRTLVTASPETVVNNIPNGGHDTRTIIIDRQNRLYVAIGSQGNVDQNSNRARIRRFNLANVFPQNFQNGEIFADGLRNEVGLDFDMQDILWGVENGADNLNRPDLGGDIHNGNPAEDLNRFDRAPGTHYGYPYCFATYNLPGYSAGTQFAWPSFMNDGVHTDAWCRNLNNNQPPVMAMPAHNAPLGIQFYRGQGCGVSIGALPCNATGDAFVAFHGSWNSDVKVGYRVAWLPFDRATNEPTGANFNVIFEQNTGCSSCFRPVNAVFTHQGHLIVSADATNQIYRIFYDATPPTIRND